MKLNKLNQKIFIGSAIFAGLVIFLHLIMYGGKTIRIDASTSQLGSSTGIGILLLLAAVLLGMEYGLLKMTESKNSIVRILGFVFLAVWILPGFAFGAGFLLFFFQ
ncbi:MAG: hypothetical protein Q4A33_00710 [Candidatus Saccharibacteria bacterium]|nr:hypothetical protein [Candidatus Saccharibacteria bacterium]